MASYVPVHFQLCGSLLFLHSVIELLFDKEWFTRGHLISKRRENSVLALPFVALRPWVSEPKWAVSSRVSLVSFFCFSQAWAWFNNLIEPQTLFWFSTNSLIFQSLCPLFCSRFLVFSSYVQTSPLWSKIQSDVDRPETVILILIEQIKSCFFLNFIIIFIETKIRSDPASTNGSSGLSAPRPSLMETVGFWSNSSGLTCLHQFH